MVQAVYMMEGYTTRTYSVYSVNREIKYVLQIQLCLTTNTVS